MSRAAFHKRAGLGYHAMGVKKETLRKLRAFRAGIDSQVFVGVLGASNLTYAEAMGSQKLADWLQSHVRMCACAHVRIS